MGLIRFIVEGVSSDTTYIGIDFHLKTCFRTYLL
jgi:hypothetical protein